VAPLRHAVGLVDREERDGAAVEQLGGRLDLEAFGREVEQVELARHVGGLHAATLRGVLGGVEERRPHADRGQGIHLILHQRDERGDDHPGALAHERGDLVAEGLATTGGHQHEGVAPGNDVVDDLGLLVAESVVAERSLEYGKRRCHNSRVYGSGAGRADPSTAGPATLRTGESPLRRNSRSTASA
jgi:hypothetical protein